MRRIFERVLAEAEAERSSAAIPCKSVSSILKEQAQKAAAHAAAAEEAEIQQKMGYDAAWATLGGRFPSIAAALKSREFREASSKDAQSYYLRLKSQPSLWLIAQAEEEHRVLNIRSAASEQLLGEGERTSVLFHERKFAELLCAQTCAQRLVCRDLCAAKVV